MNFMRNKEVSIFMFMNENINLGKIKRHCDKLMSSHQLTNS